MNPLILEISVVCLGIILLMVEAFVSKAPKSVVAHAGIVGLLGVLALSFFVDPAAITAGSSTARFYVADPVAMLFKQFALVCTIFVLVMSIEYVPIIRRMIPGVSGDAGVGEFFVLPLFTCAGLMWMASAADFVSIFVALELVTISFYVMVAYLRKSPTGLEAATKYLILGALSTGFLVYGITWVFGMTGETNLAAIGASLATMPRVNLTALLFGVALVLVGLGFKVAAVPFQFWVPDVYQGAPTPITAFLSVGSKAAGFVVLLRVLEPFYVLPAVQEKLVSALAILAGATLIYGNLAAMPQTNFKRLLAYSSIGHAGYLLMGVASVGAVMAGAAISFYLVAYLFTTMLAFLVLVIASRAVGGDDIANFNGLGKRSPWLAAAMLVSMLSLAGIPFTAGFLGKLFIFQTALAEGHVVLVVIGVITVAAGFYYYLKIARAMYWQAPSEGTVVIQSSLAAKIAMVIMVIAIFGLGVYPQPILGLFE